MVTHNLVKGGRAPRRRLFLNPRIYGTYAPTGSAALYDVDQRDRFCGGQACTASDPLPALLRVNDKDNETAASGRTYSIRTQETPLTSLHTVRSYDTAPVSAGPSGTPS